MFKKNTFVLTPKCQYQYWLQKSNHTYLNNMSKIRVLYLGCLLLTIPYFVCVLQLTETESGPWFGGPVANGSGSNNKVHVIASQMILPKATGLGGCTVVSYYQILLQKAAEYELGSSDSSKTSRPPPTTLLLIPHHSPASSFNNDAHCSSGFLSQSLLR